MMQQTNKNSSFDVIKAINRISWMIGDDMPMTSTTVFFQDVLKRKI